MPDFEGVSDSSNFQQALEQALQTALRTITHSDPMISYVVKRISGLRGGYAGFNKLTVVIEADLH